MVLNLSFIKSFSFFFNGIHLSVWSQVKIKSLFNSLLSLSWKWYADLMSNNLTQNLKLCGLEIFSSSLLAKNVTRRPTRGQVRSGKGGGRFAPLGMKSTHMYEGAVPAGGNNDGNKRQTQFNEPESPPWQEVGDGGRVYSWDFHPVHQGLSRRWGEQPVETNPWYLPNLTSSFYCHYY